MTEKARRPDASASNLVDQIITDTNKLPDVIVSLVTSPSKPLTDQQRTIITSATFFSPDSPLLGSSFFSLAKAIKRKAPLVERLGAIVLADIILEQTHLPIEEREVYRTSERNKRPLIQEAVAQLAQQDIILTDQNSKDTLKKGLILAMRGFRENLANEFSFVDSKEGCTSAFQRVAFFENFFKSDLDDAWFTMGHGGFYNQIWEAYAVYLDQAIVNALTPELLVEEKLDFLPISKKVDIWTEWVTRNRVNANAGDSEKTQALSNYFFIHPELHKEFWSNLHRSYTVAELDNPLALPHGYSLAEIPIAYWKMEWFLLQEPGVIETFLNTSQLDKEDQKKRNRILAELIGFVAFFQTCNPENENQAEIRSLLKQQMRRIGSEESFQDPMRILANESPGVIALQPNFQARAYIPLPGQTMYQILPSDQSPVYVSTAPLEKPKPQEKIFESAEIVASEDWGNVHIPHSDFVPKIINRMEDLFSVSEEESEAAFNRIDNQQSKNEGPEQKVVVIPGILEATHPVACLRTIIAGIHREGKAYSLFIDLTKIGVPVEESEPRFMMLQGKFSEETDNFLIENAPQSFVGSPLHLVITEAALLTQKMPSSEVKEGAKEQRRHAEIQPTITDWNRQNRGLHYPTLQRFPPFGTEETGVSYPISTQQVVLLTIEKPPKLTVSKVRPEKRKSGSHVDKKKNTIYGEQGRPLVSGQEIEEKVIFEESSAAEDSTPRNLAKTKVDRVTGLSSTQELDDKINQALRHNRQVSREDSIERRNRHRR